MGGRAGFARGCCDSRERGGSGAGAAQEDGVLRVAGENGEDVHKSAPCILNVRGAVEDVAPVDAGLAGAKDHALVGEGRVEHGRADLVAGRGGVHARGHALVEWEAVVLGEAVPGVFAVDGETSVAAGAEDAPDLAEPAELELVDVGEDAEGRDEVEAGVGDGERGQGVVGQDARARAEVAAAPLDVRRCDVAAPDVEVVALAEEVAQGLSAEVADRSRFAFATAQRGFRRTASDGKRGVCRTLHLLLVPMVEATLINQAADETLDSVLVVEDVIVPLVRMEARSVAGRSLDHETGSLYVLRGDAEDLQLLAEATPAGVETDRDAVEVVTVLDLEHAHTTVIVLEDLCGGMLDALVRRHPFLAPPVTTTGHFSHEDGRSRRRETGRVEVLRDRLRHSTLSDFVESLLRGLPHRRRGIALGDSAKHRGRGLGANVSQCLYGSLPYTCAIGLQSPG